jgi:hypothetical protein
MFRVLTNFWPRSVSSDSSRLYDVPNWVTLKPDSAARTAPSSWSCTATTRRPAARAAWRNDAHRRSRSSGTAQTPPSWIQ